MTSSLVFIFRPEFLEVARRLNGTDSNNDGIPDYALCMQTSNGCMDEVFTLTMILTGMLQTQASGAVKNCVTEAENPHRAFWTLIETHPSDDADGAATPALLLPPTQLLGPYHQLPHLFVVQGIQQGWFLDPKSFQFLSSTPAMRQALDVFAQLKSFTWPDGNCDLWPKRMLAGQCAMTVKWNEVSLLRGE